MKTLFSLVLIAFSLSINANHMHAAWTPGDATGAYVVLSLATSADAAQIFAGSNGAGAFYSTNTGTSWTAVNQNLGGLFVRAFVVFGSTLFAGTENGVYAASTTNFGGAAWGGWAAKNSGLTDNNVFSLAISADGTKLYAGTSGGVFLSTNNGTSWTAVNSGLTNTYVNALAVSGTHLFAATLGGVYHSLDNGTNWTAANTGLTNTNVYTMAVSGTNLFVGTDDGVFLSTNYAASWSPVNTGLASIDVNCLLVNSSYLFVGTFSGGVYRSSTNGASWTAVNASLTNAYVNALAVSGTTLYVGASYVAPVSGGAGDAATPVQMTSFTVANTQKAVTLSWGTATEVNNFGFEVERLEAANRTTATAVWEKIGFVEGHGSTNAAQAYRFIDNSASGKVVYRLKQIDRDGQFEYSQTVEAEVIVPTVYAMMQNYPNPFNPNTTITFTVPTTGRATLKVFNIVGQEVALLFDDEAAAGKYNQVQFNATGLASGVYFSRLEYDGKVQMKKMQLLK